MLLTNIISLSVQLADPLVLLHCLRLRGFETAVVLDGVAQRGFALGLQGLLCGGCHLFLRCRCGFLFVFDFLHWGGLFLVLLLLQSCKFLKENSKKVDLGLAFDRLPLKVLQISQHLLGLGLRIKPKILRLILQNKIEQLHQPHLHRKEIVSHVVLPLFLLHQLHQNQIHTLLVLSLPLEFLKLDGVNFEVFAMNFCGLFDDWLYLGAVGVRPSAQQGED